MPDYEGEAHKNDNSSGAATAHIVNTGTTGDLRLSIITVIADGNITGEAATVDGNAATALPNGNKGGEFNVWYYVAPPTSAVDYRVSFNESRNVILSVMKFSKADQDDPIRDSQGQLTTATSSSLTVTSGSQDLAFSVIGTTVNEENFAPGTGVSEKFDLAAISATLRLAGGTKAGATPNVDLGWSWATSKRIVHAAGSIKPAATGGNRSFLIFSERMRQGMERIFGGGLDPLDGLWKPDPTPQILTPATMRRAA